MYPKQHLFLGIIFSLIILLIFPQIGLPGFLIIILSSVLIDVDHYIYYVYNKKDWSLKNAYNWHIERGKKERLLKKERLKYKEIILIFHGIEYLSLLIILSIIHKFFLWILIGTIIHMVFDFIEDLNHKNPLYFKLSQIYNFITNKNKKELK
ncbi:unnamed protein product [marine sediment metagenome]|uniref:Phospholipase C/D domain-containing protein n=1 Tax=marine sediment metagenome TaxID=412755 RepID=X1C7Y4_9ZZZZ